jgi:hypothetical protein
LRRLDLLVPPEELHIPPDLEDCDEWWTETYTEDAPDPWAPGGAFAACEDFLSTHREGL